LRHCPWCFELNGMVGVAGGRSNIELWKCLMLLLPFAFVV
jgi:hypothetical protein